MKHASIFFALALASALFAADLIPAAKLPPSRMRVVNELHGLGVVGGIPARTSNVVDLSASPYFIEDGDDITSALSTATAALAHTGSEATILIPAGNFTASGYSVPNAGSLDPKKDFTLRGAGMDQTVITSTGNFQAGIEPVFTNGPSTVASGLTSDSTSVAVADPENIVADRLAIFRFPNDYRIPVTRNDTLDEYARTQVVFVTAVTGSTVTFTPPLVEDFSDLATLRGLPVLLESESNRRAVKRVGFEDFTLITTSATQNAVKFGGAYNCWIKNVKYEGAHTSHGLTVYGAVNFEARGVWVGGASSGGGSNRSGILPSYTTNLLIEDSILEDNQPCIEFWLTNTNGVFAYNYIPRGTNGLSINVHNVHNNHLLIEGNITPTYQVDTYFGSASKLVAFRNWITSRVSVPVVSITRSGTIATVTTSKPHGWESGTVSIRGATQSEYNIDAAITVTSTTAFTYSVSGSPATPATGSIFASTATFATDVQSMSRDVAFVGNILRSPTFTNTDQGYNLGYPYGGGSNGTAKFSTGDYWYDYDYPNKRLRSWVGVISGASGTTGTVTFDTAVADDMDASLALSVGRGRSASYGANFVYLGTRVGNTFALTGSSSGVQNGSWTFYPSVLGFRELDLDVGDLAIKRGNYNNFNEAIPAGEAIGADTFPDSLYHSAKPDWFGTLAWPPIDPGSPPTEFSEAEFSVLPAAYRYFNDNSTSYLGGTPTVATPAFSPSSTTHSTPQNITITSATSGSTIYYTTNGTTPTNASTLYEGPVALSYGTTTLKAIAVKSEHTDSNVRSVTYVITAESGGGAATINVLNAGTLNL